MVLDALLDQPSMFQGYIAVDPSLHWDDQFLLKKAKQVLTTNSAVPGAVYVSFANHSPTSTTDSIADQKAIEAARSFDNAGRDFTAFLQAHAPSQVRTKTQDFDQEDHASVPLLSLYHGLIHVFDGYKLPVGALVSDVPRSVLAHFKLQSERLGFEILPPRELLSALAAGYLHSVDETNRALECLRVNVTNYPGRASSYRNLAQAYTTLGKTDLAIENYERALKMDPTSESIRVDVFLAKKDYAGVQKIADDLYPASTSNERAATMLNDIAWRMALDPKISDADLARAEILARRADAASNHKSPTTIDTLARVLFREKKTEEAIRLQQKALALADEGSRANYQTTLDSYRQGVLPKTN